MIALAVQYDLKLLTTREVAPLFRVSRSTIARWCDDGIFPGAIKPRGSWLIPERAVLKQLTTPGGSPL